MTDEQLPPPMATPRVASGALFVDDEGRVLLVRPSYKPGWDLPGGYVEPGESPRAACIREVEEELGIEPPIGHMLITDWSPNVGEGDKILYVFDGGTLDTAMLAEVKLDPRELIEYDYFAAKDLVEVLNERLARRVIAALAAHNGAGPMYLEHGREIHSPTEREANETPDAAPSDSVRK